MRSVNCAKDQASVGAAKAERVRQGSPDLRLARDIRRVIEIALGILVFEVDRRRYDLVLDGQRAENRLGDARRPEQVSRRRFRRRDHDVARMVGIDELALQPDTSVEFMPGGKHLMLMRPDDGLSAVTLEFHTGDTIVLSVNVALSE